MAAQRAITFDELPTWVPPREVADRAPAVYVPAPVRADTGALRSSVANGEVLTVTFNASGSFSL